MFVKFYSLILAIFKNKNIFKSKSITKTDKQIIGDRAELVAAEYLRKQGLLIIEKNCKIFKKRLRSEVDIICKEGELLVLVEVRFRSHNSVVNAGASINKHKKMIMLKSAKVIMQKYNVLQARIDAVLIDGEKISWVKNVSSTFYK